MVIGGVSAENIGNESSNLNSINSVDSSLAMSVNSKSNDYISNSLDGNNYGSNVQIKLNYEYSDDCNSIIPDFLISSNGDSINYVKDYDSNSKIYNLKLNQSQLINGATYNITALSAGYLSQSQLLNLNLDSTLNSSLSDNSSSLILGTLSFDMKASETYKLGRDITAKADSLLNFASADEILAISSAGVPKYNGVTSEDAIQGILNQGRGTINYNDVLMLRQTANDPIDFAFIIRKGNSLTSAIFLNASSSPSYLGSISENMTKSQWNDLFKAIGGENAWSFASLANGWAHGVSYDVLQEAAFHGHICEGTLGGYSIVQALLKYYPPIKATQGGSGSPGDATSYKILGVPGGSDDDAILFFLDATPGKSGYVGFNTTSTGATENMVGFIRWTDAVVKYNNLTNAYEVTSPGSGTLIVMIYDTDANKKLFKKETGIDPDAGSLEELKYNSWWITKIQSHPEDLVTMLYELENLTEEQYYYLIGTAANVTYPTTVKNATNAGETRIEAVEAHGLDIAYIKSLSLDQATRANVTTNGSLNDEQIKEIGVNASEMAISLFEKELGIDLGRDNTNLAVFTSAGYVYLNGQCTEAAREGINQVFGSTLYSSTLLPIHVAVWKPLWFAFVLRDPNSDALYTVYLRYNDDGSFYIGELNGSNVVDIGPNTLNNSKTVFDIQKTFMPDGNWFNIQSIANAWKAFPEFDQLITFLFHDHACPGVQPGFFITDYIQSNYPLSENESYNVIASSIYCKDDSVVYLLGVSPGMGDYLNQRLPNEETESSYEDGATDEFVLVVWDKELNIGRAVIISFKWATIDTSAYTTSEAKRAAQIQAYIDMYANRYNSNVKEPVSVSANEERYITAEQFLAIKSGSGDANALTYVKNMPFVSKEDLLNSMNQNNQNNQNQNQNNPNSGSVIAPSGSSSQSSSSSGSNSGYNSGSSGSSAAGVGVGSSADLSSSAGESNLVSAANTVSESEDSESGDSAANGKAYEVSQPATKSIDSNNIVYAIVGILIVGVLVGFGFMRNKK